MSSFKRRSRNPGQETSSEMNMSSAEANYCRSQGTPSATTVPDGVTDLNNALRSVIANRPFFETFLGFNRNNAVDANKAFLNRLFQQHELDSLDFWADESQKGKGMVSEAANKSTEERKITEAMVENLKKFFEEGVTDQVGKEIVVETEHIKVLSEARLESLEEDKKGSVPRLDVAVCSDENLLAFVEVGLINDAAMEATMNMRIDKLFWEKVHQTMNYLKRLKKGVTGATKDNDETVFKVNNTFMFSVIFFEKKQHSIARMAIFCAQPKTSGDPDFRVAMMYRREFTGLEGLDAAYSAFIKATVHLMSRNGDMDSTWRYLGPDCTLVTASDGEKEKYVLRGYDNRVRSTPRSPIVYKNIPELIHYEEVIKVEDPGISDLLQFGELLGPENQNQHDHLCSMLFYDETVSKRGQMEVIAVPFIEGTHKFTTINQALDVVRFLKHMHEKGYVHGDIRGFNLIASDQEGASQPIDFDFGGRVSESEEDSVKYPPGYIPEPGDGIRPGEPGQPIKKEHDVRSLISVLFGYHDITPDRAELTLMTCRCTEEESLSQEKILKGLDLLHDKSPVLAYTTMKQVEDAFVTIKASVLELNRKLAEKGKQEVTIAFVPSTLWGYDERLLAHEGPKFGCSIQPKDDESKSAKTIASGTRKTTGQQGTPWGAQYTPAIKVKSPQKGAKFRKTGTTSRFGRVRSDVENRSASVPKN